MNEGRLAGKVCVVTGGARGLGLAVAEAIAAEGAAVALLDVLPQVAASAEALATSSGARTVGVVCNVTSEESVRAALDAVEESLGGADLLVNAAGVSLGTPALETSLDSWRRLIDINLTGTFLLCRDFARDCVVAGRPERS